MPSMIELIKELRDRTGAGMMDCKKALEASNEDVEKAIDWLREKGIAKAQAKASRIAAEGLAHVEVEGDKAVIVEVNCETDFVSKGEKFHKLTEDVAKATLAGGFKTIEEAKEATKQLFTDATVAMGEKLDYRRFEVATKAAGEGFGSYVHMGGKIGTLVVLEKEDAELAKGLAMHIAANSPKYVSEADIPADVIEHEKGIFLEQIKDDPKMAGKPEQMIQGIVAGKVKKLLAESVLGTQVYLMDGEKTVAAVLKEKGNNVKKFVRFAVGEGIEKRQDDFAAEVMSQIK